MNVVAFTMLLGIVSLLAWRAGGGPERWTATTYLLGAGATFLTYRTLSERFTTIEPYVAAIDLLVMGSLTVILLRADRFWPIAAFAAQGVAVMTHVVKLIDPGIIRKAYAIALALPGWLAVVALLAGVVRHRSRVRRFGAERDWS